MKFLRTWGDEETNQFLVMEEIISGRSVQTGTIHQMIQMQICVGATGNNLQGKLLSINNY